MASGSAGRLFQTERVIVFFSLSVREKLKQELFYGRLKEFLRRCGVEKARRACESFCAMVPGSAGGLFQTERVIVFLSFGAREIGAGTFSSQSGIKGFREKG